MLAHVDSIITVCTYQDQVTELLHLHARLERQLQLATLDDDVGEVKQVDLKRIQHALAGDDDLLRLFLHRQRTHKSRHFFGRLPLRQLSKTLLPSPYTRVDDLQEELTRTRVEDEDSTVCEQ